jgi:hypothetical protein
VEAAMYSRSFRHCPDCLAPAAGKLIASLPNAADKV